MAPVNNKTNNNPYRPIKPAKTVDGKYRYSIPGNGKGKEMNIITSNNDGSVHVDDQGKVYAQNLNGANIQGTDGDDNVTLYDCQVDKCNLGKGDETLNAMGTTSFANKVEFDDNKGDKFNVENMKTAFGKMKDWCKGMFNSSVNTNMPTEQKAQIANSKSAINAQENKEATSANEAAKSAEETQKPGTPDSSSVKVNPWGTGKDDCLSRIVDGHYKDFATQDNKSDIYKAIQNINPQIKDLNLVYTNDNIKLPSFEVGDDGKISGYSYKDENGKTTRYGMDGNVIEDKPVETSTTPEGSTVHTSSSGQVHGGGGGSFGEPEVSKSAAAPEPQTSGTTSETASAEKSKSTGHTTSSGKTHGGSGSNEAQADKTTRKLIPNGDGTYTVNVLDKDGNIISSEHFSRTGKIG